MIYSISPLDGRYAETLEGLSEYFSEFALMRERCLAELLYLESLFENRVFPPPTPAEIKRIENAKMNFGESDFGEIKRHEASVRHDVKACELFLRGALKLSGGRENALHFGLTSEDVNNIAYSSLFRAYLQNEQLPLLKRIILALAALSREWKSAPFPARTHGQPASPSTAGKETAVFASRLLDQHARLAGFRFRAKLNGATGNYSAHASAFPDFDWIGFSEKFIRELGFDFSAATTQVEPGDSLCEYLDAVRRVNCVLLDLTRDFWLYISFGFFVEKARTGEVGSSTMPHKVNPINFENAEGNLQISNALLSMMSEKFCQSRMQRDLSGSTVMRNVGVALAHSHLALLETEKGLSKVKLDSERCLQEIRRTPEVIAEPAQTILRAAGAKDPYEKLRSATRGRKVSSDDIKAAAESFAPDARARNAINELSPEGYVGLAARVCDDVLKRVKNELKG